MILEVGGWLQDKEFQAIISVSCLILRTTGNYLAYRHRWKHPRSSQNPPQLISHSATAKPNTPTQQYRLPRPPTPRTVSTLVRRRNIPPNLSLDCRDANLSPSASISIPPLPSTTSPPSSSTNKTDLHIGHCRRKSTPSSNHRPIQPSPKICVQGNLAAASGSSPVWNGVIQMLHSRSLTGMIRRGMIGRRSMNFWAGEGVGLGE